MAGADSLLAGQGGGVRDKGWGGVLVQDCLRGHRVLEVLGLHFPAVSFPRHTPPPPHPGGHRDCSPG